MRFRGGPWAPSIRGGYVGLVLGPLGPRAIWVPGSLGHPGSSPEPKEYACPEPREYEFPEPREYEFPRPKEYESPEPKEYEFPEPKEYEFPKPKKYEV